MPLAWEKKKQFSGHLLNNWGSSEPVMLGHRDGQYPSGGKEAGVPNSQHQQAPWKSMLWLGVIVSDEFSTSVIPYRNYKDGNICFQD